jgi:transcriptional regulator with XRE-family HTH domain
MEIRKLRDRLGLTVDEFATKLRVKPVSVSQWEKGEVAPNRLALEALERLIEVNARSTAITDLQIKQFEHLGAATIGSPISPGQVRPAAATLDWHLPFVAPKDEKEEQWSFAIYRVARFDDYFDAELLTFIQHPFFETVAQRFLKTDAVEFFGSAILKTYPQSGADGWLPPCHVELCRQLRSHSHIQPGPHLRHLGRAEHLAQHCETAVLKLLNLLCKYGLIRRAGYGLAPGRQQTSSNLWLQFGHCDEGLARIPDWDCKTLCLFDGILSIPSSLQDDHTHGCRGPPVLVVVRRV